jgi:dCTP deaminase
MILSDGDIRRRLRVGDLVVSPLLDEKTQIQPASVDLRLAEEFILFRPAQVDYLDPRKPDSIGRASERVRIDPQEGLLLAPGVFALGSTVESVRIPRDLVGVVDGRSSIGRLAVLVHATAGFIDPGFEGQITLELSNIGPIPVKLYPGMRIAQIVLYQMSSPAEIPYGAERGSKYCQQAGPQLSKISLDEPSTMSMASQSSDVRKPVPG